MKGDNMKYFTMLLIVMVAGTGFLGGYRLITGRDLVSLDSVFQREPVASAAQAPTSIPIQPPTPVPTEAPEVDSEPEFEPWWIQNHREAELWSGMDADAVSFGTVPQWTTFLVVEPQAGPRLYVLNPATENYAYIDADAVGPASGAPRPTSEPAPASGSLQPIASADAPATMVVGNTDGMGVYVRRTPNMGDRLRAWPDNTRMEVLERDVSSEGRSWHKVRTPDGSEGYVPVEYLLPR
jgi:hypothetical protein